MAKRLLTYSVFLYGFAFVAGFACSHLGKKPHAVQPTPPDWELAGKWKERSCSVGETIDFPKLDDPAISRRKVVVLECRDGQRMVDYRTQEERVFVANGETR